MEHIEFEGEKYWELGDKWGEWHKPDIFLASDSSLRPDIGYLKAKDYEHAQTAKEDLEEQQRVDKHNRQKNGKK